MASNNHTYGAKCRLAPVTHLHRDDAMPSVEAQFFYSSVIPIDDPLSTSSISGADGKTGKGQLRPFARGDNNALEKAWLGLISETDNASHREAWKDHKSLDRSLSQPDSDKLASIVYDLTSKHWDRHRNGYQTQDVALPTTDLLTAISVPTCCSELVVDVSEQLVGSFCSILRHKKPGLKVEEVTNQIVMALDRLREEASYGTEPKLLSRDTHSSRPGTASSSNTNPHPITRFSKTRSEARNIRNRQDDGESSAKAMAFSMSQPKSQLSRTQTPIGSLEPTRPSTADDGISGKPFVRVGSPEAQPEPSSVAFTQMDSTIQDLPWKTGQKKMVNERDSKPHKTEQRQESAPALKQPDTAEVAVGASRLHMVSLPMLQMKPIYWSPVNDIAVVTRATWFYR